MVLVSLKVWFRALTEQLGLRHWAFPVARRLARLGTPASRCGGRCHRLFGLVGHVDANLPTLSLIATRRDTRRNEKAGRSKVHRFHCYLVPIGSPLTDMQRRIAGNTVALCRPRDGGLQLQDQHPYFCPRRQRQHLHWLSPEPQRSLSLSRPGHHADSNATSQQP